MKLFLSLVMTAVVLQAVEKSDFAFERTVNMPSEQGIVKIDLPLALYNHINTKSMLDLAIFDANNKIMPHALKQLDTSERRVQTEALSFSRVKTIKEKKDSTLNINYQGKELTLTENSKISDEDYILDASKMEAGIDYLQVQSSDREYMFATDVACSSDLTYWNPVASGQMLANITMQESAITKDRLTLNTGACNYLKVHTQKRLNIETITAVKKQTHFRKPKPQAVHLTKVDNGLEFSVSKQVTLKELQFHLPPKEQLYRLNLLSRNENTTQWSLVQKITVYSLYNGAISKLHTTLYTNADHYRLEAAENSFLPQELTLSFSYDPVQLYFIAQGTPPYSLVYGSMKTTPPSADLRSMIKLNTNVVQATLNTEKVLNSTANTIIEETNYTVILVWLSLAVGVIILGFMSYILVGELKLNQKEDER